MPPHHMNLWGEDSLEKLAEFFTMEFERFLFEPLQPYHYQAAASGWLFDNIKPLIVAKVMNKLMKLTRSYKLARLFSKKVKGHSIIAI